MALLSGGVGNFYCESVKFVPTQNNGTIPTLYFGPWYQRETVLTSVNTGGSTTVFINQVCVPLQNGIDIDSKWKTVRAFSIITLVIGFFKVLGLYFVPCTGRADKHFKKGGMFIAILLTLFQGLYFLFLMDGSSSCDPFTPLYGRSDNTESQNTLLSNYYTDGCQWAGGSTAAAVATGLWFLTGLSMLIIGTPNRDTTPPPETQAVTYQKTTNPDGTTAVVEEAVVKGHAVDTTVQDGAIPATTGLEDKA